MDLIREILDKQVVDRRGASMGKVDGIVLEMRADGPPRVAFLEIGPSALAHRFHPLLGRWMEALAEHFGLGDGVLEVAASKVVEWQVDVKLDVDARETTARAWEDWLARHVIGKIPGSDV